MDLAATEYDRFVDLIRELDPDDWGRTTECPAWDVADMVRHVLGAAEAHGSQEEQQHQMEAASGEPGPMIDALGVVQIRDRADLTAVELVERLEEAAPRSVGARRQVPAAIREQEMTVDAPFQWGGEKWRLGYLLDVIYTRDTWMHRLDIARATGRDMVLGPGHDARIVADVVAEWARRHGQPFALTLTGVAGGNYAAADGGERLELDAVEFCRIVSGRAPGAGLLTTEVPF
ncbi:MAG: maleylpyruvate isomerase family mycothiol-dependent enzyme [Actinobacteria bacterium]|nr:maleylpyruvate isomerase family mycothiol-dependent enzyme [Actinomycetota bacterium]